MVLRKRKYGSLKTENRRQRESLPSQPSSSANQQERKLTPAWDRDKERVVDQILVNWGLESQFSEEDVFRVEGILDVNTIEYFPCPKDPNRKDGMHFL